MSFIRYTCVVLEVSSRASLLCSKLTQAIPPSRSAVQTWVFSNTWLAYVTCPTCTCQNTYMGICVNIAICVHITLCISTCIYVYRDVYAHVCVLYGWLATHVYTDVYLYLYMYRYMYMYMCICKYVYVEAYIHVYKYI